LLRALLVIARVLGGRDERLRSALASLATDSFWGRAAGSGVVIGSGAFGVRWSGRVGAGVACVVVAVVVLLTAPVALGAAGDFSAAGTSPEAAGTNPNSVAVGDFNGDGKQDLATANFASNDVTIMLGDGSGNFNAA